MSLSLILLLSCCFYLAIGMPVAFALGFSTLTALIFGADFPLFVLLKQTYEGVDSFPLMAVPFFILAAELMSGGSLTEVLLKFAAQFVGHKRGGLGYTNVVSLTFFSGISGSALADAAGPGSMMIRMMDKAGYDRSYAAALTAATAIVGPIIPPSIIMIIYALQDDRVSVGALFVAGFIPGILIAAGMALVNFYVSKKRNYKGIPGNETFAEKMLVTWKAIPALMLSGRRVLRLGVWQMDLPHLGVESRARHLVALSPHDRLGAHHHRHLKCLCLDFDHRWLAHQTG
jgi:tripartite ATP-independent transporter DctM subunit